jgi:predicted nucleotidyltransferase
MLFVSSAIIEQLVVNSRDKAMKKKVRQLIDSLLPYEPERLYLFGSWARREDDELSDMDVVVIKDTSSPFFDRLREISGFLPAEIGGLDILVYTPKEFARMRREGNAFVEMILEEGSLIYERKAENRS